MSTLPLRPLGFGEILDGAFTLYRHNFTPFFTTALLAAIPLSLLTASIESATLGMETGSEPDAAMLGRVLLAVPLSGLLWALVWGALTRQTAARYEGRVSSVRDGYSRALRLLPRFVGQGIIIMALATAAVIALSILFTVMMLPLGLLAGNSVATAVYGGFATLLAVAVGFALMSSLFAVVPAVVVEDLGAWAAIQRSHRLARGARARVVGILLVSSLIVVLPTLGLMIAVGLGTALWDVATAATLNPLQLWLQQVVTIVSTALTVPFMVGCVTLLYFDRRVRSEGYDLELAAAALSEPALS